MIKIGDRVTTWFSDEPDGKSTVLEVKPYTGMYQQCFDTVLVVTAPRTRQGKMEMAFDSKGEIYEKRLHRK